MAIAATATPAPAPTTSTVSSARSWARVVSIRHAVRKVSGNAAASSQLRPAGLRKTLRASMWMSSHAVPSECSPSTPKRAHFTFSPGPAQFALPAAEGGEDDDLVTRLPRRVAGRVDDARAVGGDDARGRDALGAVGEPEVQVVDRGGLDCDRDGARLGLGPRPLANPHAVGSDRLLVTPPPAPGSERCSLEAALGAHLRNLTRSRGRRKAPQPKLGLRFKGYAGLGFCAHVLLCSCCASPCRPPHAQPPGHQAGQYVRWSYPSQMSYGPMRTARATPGCAPAPAPS